MDLEMRWRVSSNGHGNSWVARTTVITFEHDGESRVLPPWHHDHVSCVHGVTSAQRMMAL